MLKPVHEEGFLDVIEGFCLPPGTMDRRHIFPIVFGVMG